MKARKEGRQTRPQISDALNVYVGDNCIASHSTSVWTVLNLRAALERRQTKDYYIEGKRNRPPAGVISPDRDI